MTDDRDVVLGDQDDTGITKQRRGAALYDVIVLGWALGVLAVPARELLPLFTQASLLVLWLLLVLVEGVLGRSPGKIVTGIEVVRLDGRPVTLLTAALRRPWGWLLPLQLVGGAARSVAMVAALAIMIAMAVSTRFGGDRPGVHDRLAGTEVVEGTFDPRARLVVVVTTLAAAVLGFVLAAATTPITPA